MIGLPSPWLVVAVLGAIGAVGVIGYEEGRESGEASVQVKWDRREAQLALASAENTRLARAASDKLQGERDEERKQTAGQVAALGADVERLARSLSERAARPAPGPAAPGAPAGPGPRVGTGLGLYREDGVFLVGEAATGKRVKLQRDECYAAYGRAQKEIERLAAPN